jgi:hypothetical protein
MIDHNNNTENGPKDCTQELIELIDNISSTSK